MPRERAQTRANEGRPRVKSCAVTYVYASRHAVSAIFLVVRRRPLPPSEPWPCAAAAAAALTTFAALAPGAQQTASRLWRSANGTESRRSADGESHRRDGRRQLTQVDPCVTLRVVALDSTQPLRVCEAAHHIHVAVERRRRV